MNYLTLSEHRKIREITQRLEDLQSPVLRLQAILQFSQIVDILAIGDSAQPLHDRIASDIETIDELQNKELERQEQEEYANKAYEDAPNHDPHTQAERSRPVENVETPQNRPHPQAAMPRGAAVAAFTPDELTDADGAA
jgi:hypothetical protein